MSVVVVLKVQGLALLVEAWCYQCYQCNWCSGRFCKYGKLKELPREPHFWAFGTNQY
jgi:hypothetical protein